MDLAKALIESFLHYNDGAAIGFFRNFFIAVLIVGAYSAWMDIRAGAHQIQPARFALSQVYYILAMASLVFCFAGREGWWAQGLIDPMLYFGALILLILVHFVIITSLSKPFEQARKDFRQQARQGKKEK